MDENWVRICEIDKNEKTWLHDMLEENNIPYKDEVEPYWTGTKIPKYKEKLYILTPEKYAKEVLGYIEEFNNPNNIIADNSENFNNSKISTSEEEELNKSIRIRKRMLLLAFIVPLCMALIPLIIKVILDMFN